MKKRAITAPMLKEYLDLLGADVVADNYDVIILEKGGSTWVLFHQTARIKHYCHFDLHDIKCVHRDEVIDLVAPGSI